MDSYRGNSNDPLSLNLYTYCANNPILYVDPSGHAPNSYYTPPQLNMINDAVEYTEGSRKGATEFGKIGVETALDVIADAYALFTGKTIFGEEQDRLLSLLFIALPELIEQGGKSVAKIAPDLIKRTKHLDISDDALKWLKKAILIMWYTMEYKMVKKFIQE